MADSKGGTAEFPSPAQDGVTALGASEASLAWEMGTHSHCGAALLSSSSDSGSPAWAPPRRAEMVKVHAVCRRPRLWLPLPAPCPVQRPPIPR